MKIKIIYLYIFSLLLVACNNLDVPPMNIVKDSDIFTSESGIEAYLSRLYSDLPFGTIADEKTVNHFTGEAATCNYGWIGTLSNSIGGYWNYEHVRNINYFIQEMLEYRSAFSDENVNTWLGEAYFMRAFTYFNMVKCYGGIPIVKEVFDYNGQPMEDLYLGRNTEKECYNFILSDLEEAITLLPEKNEAGRVDKYVAYGMKARVALWAASIAKYGNMQLDGILGIPKEEAKYYFNLAYTAALETSNGGYELYNDGSGDLANSYSKIFLDKSSKENMFVKLHQYPNNGTSIDRDFIPWQIRGPEGYSGRANPTLDFIELFDDIEGNPFKLNTGTDENPILYDDRMDIFEKAEPRLKGVVIFPGDEFKGTVIDVRKGIIPSGGTMLDLLSTGSFGDLYEGMPIQGASGLGGGETTVTGFYLRKWLDPSLDQSNVASGKSETSWIEMRYAEMLLTRAEAAVELSTLGDDSMLDDAVDCINMVRNRAGAKKMYSRSDLLNTEDPKGIDPKGIHLVRKEWKMEFFFECKTYWNMRRWRTYDKEVSNRYWNVLWPIYVWDEQKYYMKREQYTNYSFNFLPIYYYMPISGSEIQKNPLLIQNPGY